MLQELLQSGTVWFGAGEEAAVGNVRHERSEFCSLPSGYIHEWSFASDFSSKRGGLWFPPFAALAQAIRSSLQAGLVVWIGGRCWPTPMVLSQIVGNDSLRELVARCVFVHPDKQTNRLWSAVEALGSCGVAVVVLDGSGFSMMETRRLQLAARDGESLGLLVRPPWEMTQASVAQSRWMVRAHAFEEGVPGWEVELLQAKGELKRKLRSYCLWEGEEPAVEEDWEDERLQCGA